MKKQKYYITPLNVIGYLHDVCKYYKEEWVPKEDWEKAEEIYQELLKAYHIYIGVKKDYRKKKKK